MSYIEVTYDVCSSSWKSRQVLKKLATYPLLSFDTETRPVYSKEERAEANKLLKQENLPRDVKKLLSLSSNTSGLSFPSLINVTHFIFGISNSESVIIVTQYPHEEFLIWNWLAAYKGKLLIHNTLFDLKIMYHRIHKFPQDFEDTQLLAKVLINNADIWKSKVGLKELMGSYYDPQWTLIDSYEPENLKDPKFLRYASIDGAAVIKLWEDTQEYCNVENRTDA